MGLFLFLLGILRMFAGYNFDFQLPVFILLNNSLTVVGIFFFLSYLNTY